MKRREDFRERGGIKEESFREAAEMARRGADTAEEEGNKEFQREEREKEGPLTTAKLNSTGKSIDEIERRRGRRILPALRRDGEGEEEGWKGKLNISFGNCGYNG